VNFIGIDPSQRHTGLCVLRDSGPSFFEIQPKQDNILECMEYLAEEFSSFLAENSGIETMICVERQLSVGGQSSSLMFLVQMLILNCIKKHRPTQKMELVMPLPIQLKSYITKMHGIETKSKSSIVAGFRKQMDWQKRISSHRVEAYYLAKLAKDVLLGRWQYKLPSRETNLFEGTIING